VTATPESEAPPLNSAANPVATLAFLLQSAGEDIANAMIRRAKTGDAAAARLCLEQITPRRRERVVPVSLPPINSTDDARRAASDIAAAVAAGTITPREATELLRVVEGFTRVLRAAHQADGREPGVHHTTFRWLYQWENESLADWRKRVEEDERQRQAKFDRGELVDLSEPSHKQGARK